MDFIISLLIFTKKIWDLDWDCDETMDQFGGELISKVLNL